MFSCEDASTRATNGRPALAKDDQSVQQPNQDSTMAVDVTNGECQPATEEELLVRLDDVLRDYAAVPGALIPVLQIAQAMFGYLPETALRKISLALGKPYSEVAGVVTFYSYFTTVPRGKHLVRVCLGTACYVRGGKEVLASLKVRPRRRSGRNHARPALLSRRGPLFRRLWTGAGHHDRRRRAPAGEAGPGGQDSRKLSASGDKRRQRRRAYDGDSRQRTDN